MAWCRFHIKYFLASIGRCWTRQKSRHKRANKCQASVSFNGSMHHLGHFHCEVEAASAYDSGLRSLCKDGVRLKKSLNFPTCSEQYFVESAQKARARAITTYGGNFHKEKLSLWRLQRLFLKSPASCTFEMYASQIHRDWGHVSNQ